MHLIFFLKKLFLRWGGRPPQRVCFCFLNYLLFALGRWPAPTQLIFFKKFFVLRGGGDDFFDRRHARTNRQKKFFLATRPRMRLTAETLNAPGRVLPFRRNARTANSRFFCSVSLTIICNSFQL